MYNTSPLHFYIQSFVRLVLRYLPTLIKDACYQFQTLRRGGQRLYCSLEYESYSSVIERIMYFEKHLTINRQFQTYVKRWGGGAGSPASQAEDPLEDLRKGLF